MVKTSLLIATLALLTGYANAECNNMCSGHGICGANDACTCYRNWRGNDCSERTCQYGVAFVDTAQGDLDHDGTLESGTLVTTQWAPSQTFEQFPNTQAQEAHFYMECSNKGLCDRSSGVCVCFDGYEGSACQRTVCYNSCSGHGVCRNIVDKIQALSTEKRYEYKLWDGLKNQACVCDPGYSGVDCSQRLCPKGADPLDHEDSGNNPRVIEVQKVTLDHSSLLADGAGTFTLSYEDLFGEVWTTSAITYSNTAGTFATRISDALKAIPNSVIEDVTVTCAATTSTNGLDCSVTFTQNPGNLNEMTISAVAWADAEAVSTTTAGTKIATECSSRGLCDYETGLCKCFRGYRLDDCSSQHALAYGTV